MNAGKTNKQTKRTKTNKKQKRNKNGNVTKQETYNGNENNDKSLSQLVERELPQTDNSGHSKVLLNGLLSYKISIFFE